MDKSIYGLAAIKHAKRRKARKVRRLREKHIEPEYRPGVMKSDFYLTREWKKLRWEVLRISDGKCQMCGRSKEEGVILHVDHIRPRSKYPYLELDLDNLQVLCADCNLGKGTETWGRVKPVSKETHTDSAVDPRPNPTGSDASDYKATNGQPEGTKAAPRIFRRVRGT